MSTSCLLTANYWLLVSIIFICSLVRPITSEPFYTLRYNGKCWATISGTDPDSEILGCDADWYKMPDGWQIAEAGADTTKIATTYPWGTHLLVFGEPRGHGWYLRSETWEHTRMYSSPGIGSNMYVMFQEPDQYKPPGCNSRVLISKQCGGRCTDPTDYNLLFIVDESGSVTAANYASTIDFMIDLIKHDVNKIAKLAVLSYSNTNDMVYYFTNEQNDDRVKIINALEVEKKDYSGTNTQTLTALQSGLQQFKDNPDIRNTDNNLIMLFTDGNSSTPICSADYTDLLHELNGYNIRLIVVAIGITSSFDQSSISCITKNADIYEIANFASESFQTVKDGLKNTLCPHPACPSRYSSDSSVSSGLAIPYKNNDNFEYDGMHKISNDNPMDYDEYTNLEYINIGIGFCAGIILSCCIGLMLLNFSGNLKSKGYIRPEFQDDTE